MKRSMMTEARASPEMIAPPKPLQRAFAIVIGNKPRMVLSLVRMIGSSLLAPASAIASFMPIPSLRLMFILSTMNMELVTTMPKRDSTPIRAGNERGVPVRAKT